MWPPASWIFSTERLTTIIETTRIIANSDKVGFDFSLLKYALDPVKIVFLHFDQGLRDEPVVNACLVEFLELLSLVQVR